MTGSAALAVLVHGLLATTAPTPAKITVALMTFDANPAAQGQVHAMESLLSQRLSAQPELQLFTREDIQTLLGLERQRQLLGEHQTCTDQACVTELGGAVGARYVISGRVDRFDERFVVTAVLYDTQAAQAKARPSVEVTGEGALPQAATDLANEVFAALNLEPPKGSGPDQSGKPGAASVGEVSLGLKVGPSFVAHLAQLSPSGEIEVGYRFHREWVGYLQVGVNLLHATSADSSGDLTVVPSVIGARHLHRLDARLQPYWGLALGLQLALGPLAIVTQTGPLPTVVGILGGQYLLTPHLSAGLEATTNLAQTILGVTSDHTGKGVNVNLSGALVYRF